MQNFLKNIYCDFILVTKVPLSLFKKIIFIIQKYVYVFLYIFGVKNFRLFSNKYITHEPFGIMGMSIMLKDYYEYYFQKINSKDPVIFDVGANVGNFTLATKIFYPNANVYAFEPVPNTFSICRNNTKHLDNVVLENLGLGSKEGKMEMFTSLKESDRASFEADNLKDSDDVVKQEVSIVTLDKYVSDKNLQKIDLLKIDVEGFETEVIKGAIETLKITEWIIMETHMKDGGKTFSEIINFMNENKFDLYKFGKVWTSKDEPVYC